MKKNKNNLEYNDLEYNMEGLIDLSEELIITKDEELEENLAKQLAKEKEYMKYVRAFNTYRYM